MIKRMTKRQKRFISAGVAALVVVAVIGIGFGVSGASSSSYVLANAHLGSVAQTIGTTGLLEPTTEVGLNFGISGLVQTVNVQPGQAVQAGQLLATLNNTSLQNALAQAQANLASAQAKLSLDTAGPTPAQQAQASAAVASARLDVSNATTNLQDATQTLAIAQTNLVNYQADVNNGPGAGQSVPAYSATSDSTVPLLQNVLLLDQQIENADSQSLTAAQQSLSQAQSNEQTDCSSTVSSTTTTVASSGSTLCFDDRSQATLAGSWVNADTQASTQAQSCYSAANQVIALFEQLETSQLALSNAVNAQNALAAPPPPAQISMDNSAVQIAQTQVQTAQANLSEAQITAPTSGVIGQVNISVGQQATPNSGSLGGGGAAAASSNPNSSGSGGVTGAIVLINPSAFQAVASVSDAQISQVQTGDKVFITPAGFVKSIPGVVTQVTPVGTLSQGVIAYPVTATINDPPSIKLFTGESAQIAFIVKQVSNVLVVPTSAVHTVGARNFVYVLKDGHKIRQKVVIGASDAVFTQVESGLSAGDQVILANAKTPLPSATSGFGGFGGNRKKGGGPGVGGPGAGGAGGAGGGAKAGRIKGL
ncbi:MAG: biotin/lipoyl-binding protein [Actinobacteria bacterium]|nr:biotin/lipoyl-binding protein [Actinomycetota bacterium]